MRPLFCPGRPNVAPRSDSEASCELLRNHTWGSTRAAGPRRNPAEAPTVVLRALCRRGRFGQEVLDAGVVDVNELGRNDTKTELEDTHAAGSTLHNDALENKSPRTRSGKTQLRTHLMPHVVAKRFHLETVRGSVDKTRG